MHEKVAWVVTDWMNGACGMERKETTEAVGCWGECMKWKQNEMQGFGERNERSSRNGMGWNEYTDRKHMDNQYGMFLVFCTTTGWWGNIEVLNQILSQSILVWEWGSSQTPGIPKCFVATVPIGKPVMVFIATRNFSQWKLQVAFGALFSGWRSLNDAPIRCNYLPLCLQAINGANSTQK